jgi:hypothetical protein
VRFESRRGPSWLRPDRGMIARSSGTRG